MSDQSTSTPVADRKRETTPAKTEPQKLPPYNVVLLDDDDHTYEYVIEMLTSLFGHPKEMGFKLAKQVDRDGRAIVCTTHKERAEFKRDQIGAFGIDMRISACAGSMSAVIEPAEM
jgi:ATP-dependent Clp protease adaptor protein ClpS